MFTEDKLATAQIAQLFGSELLKVQQNATTDSGSQPDIVKLDPQQFLARDSHFQSNRKAEEQRLIQMLQREAEAAYPSPEEPVAHQQPINPIPASNVAPKIQPISPQPAVAHVSAASDVWERINFNLERIANKLDTVDIQIKKKRVKRTTK